VTCFRILQKKIFVEKIGARPFNSVLPSFAKKRDRFVKWTICADPVARYATRDRWYDFKIIFAKKLAFFVQTTLIFAKFGS
jgi:hypothetical protein